MTFSATYFGSSGWLIELGDIRILIDPWLRGKLSFPPGPWLIEGRLKEEFEVPERINLILLTQGLADHTHTPSLELLSKEIPLIGSSSASKVAKSIGFDHVFELKPGEKQNLLGLEIEATAGAAVPGLENGYIISNTFGSFYIEPHGFFDKRIAPRKLDAVITPILNLKLPFAGSFIQGKKVLPQLIKSLQPLTVLASTTGGDSIFSGVLNHLIKVEGNIEETSIYLRGKTNFIEPIVGNSYKLKTRSVN
tara:strand:+ start:1046 stop:1795 length:750 start_codon:yes stop_codon:yes gene_type:complete